MRVHYLDTSAWVKRYFEESGSGRIRQLFEGREPLAGSSVGYLEASAAVARQTWLNKHRRNLLEAQLDVEWPRFLQLEITADTFALGVVLTRQFRLGGADALHLAIVKQVHDTFTAAGDELIFWIADGDLIHAASLLGMEIATPDEP